MHIVRQCGTLVGCWLLVAILAGGKWAPQPEVDLSQYDFREGDIVFQHLPGQLGSVICDVTKSQLSHCGMVVRRNGELQVLEAIGPVRYRSLKKWIEQGDRRRFVQMRLRKLSQEELTKTIKAADQFVGRPYDLQYELDDEKIYCSELVYKAYLAGTGREIGKKEKLRELNWKPSEDFIRALAGGELPLDREMVTPVAVSRSSELKLVYSSFPPRKDEPLYETKSLAGKWQGEYSIKKLAPATASLKFNARGEFSSGSIQLENGAKVSVKELRIDPFKSQREFKAKIRDDRGITGDVKSSIHDEGRRIVGTWKDDLGYVGVFSIEKQAPVE